MATTSTRRRKFFSGRLQRQAGIAPGAAIHGTARLGRRTKDLVKRLGPADIAVISHTNIDRIAAEELIATGVRVVLNAAESTNGRYPNAGPLLLTQAGVRLIDIPGTGLFDTIKDGDHVVATAKPGAAMMAGNPGICI